MIWLWWAGPLILAVFVWTLNEYLRGRRKEITSGVLALLIFALVAIAFVVSGWKVGIGALVGAFVVANLVRPIAIALARRLISYPDLGFDDYNQRRFKRAMADFGSESFKRSERPNRKESSNKNEIVSKAMKAQAIGEVLTRFSATERDLAAFYDRIEVQSVPPQARRTVLHNARLVAFFLENSEPYEMYDGRYGRKVSVDTALRLQLWTNRNPGGDEPNLV